MSKNVLITGGCGFIAHHVIDLLIQKTDWNITTLDRLDYSGNLNRLHEVLEKYDAQTRKRVNVVFHDLKAEINPLVNNFINKLGKIDTILHLAASSHVDRSITHPMEFIQDNTIGTAHLLEYARRLDNLETFLYFSTDEIFGSAPPGVAYTERARYNSTNPYSASKAAAEEFCVAYENTYKMPMMITFMPQM
jgi:dTDP-glucose 4,6-dehydratase